MDNYMEEFKERFAAIQKANIETQERIDSMNARLARLDELDVEIEERMAQLRASSALMDKKISALDESCRSLIYEQGRLKGANLVLQAVYGAMDLPKPEGGLR